MVNQLVRQAFPDAITEDISDDVEAPAVNEPDTSETIVDAPTSWRSEFMRMSEVKPTLSAFSGVEFEINHAPSIVGGEWFHQLNRMADCNPRVPSDAAISSNLGVLGSNDSAARVVNQLLCRCKVTVSVIDNVSNISVVAPNISDAKKLASMLTIVNVLDMEPSNPNHVGRIMFSRVQVGARPSSRVLINVSRDDAGILTSVTDLVDTNDDLQDGALALTITHVKGKGTCTVKHAHLPNIKAIEGIGSIAF